MMIHKITQIHNTQDYNWWLKRLYTQLTEPTKFKKSPKGG